MIKISLLFISLILVAAMPAHADDAAEAAKMVEALCSQEFAGIPDAKYYFTKYTPEREKAEIKRNPNSRGTTYYWAHDPSIIVTSYKVQKVAATSNEADVEVIFRRVGRSDKAKHKTDIVADLLPEEHVRYHVIKTNEKWLVLDPPLPHISKDSMLKYHKEKIDQAGPGWLQRTDISEAQRVNHRKLLTNLEKLKELPD